MESDGLEQHLKFAFENDNGCGKMSNAPVNFYIERHSDVHRPSKRQRTIRDFIMQVYALEQSRLQREKESMEFNRIIRNESYPYSSANDEELINDSIKNDKKYDTAWKGKHDHIHYNIYKNRL